MTVQVKAQFAKDESQFNGLDAVRKELIDKPLTPRILVAVVDVVEVKHDILSGADTPKIRLRQVEVLDGSAAARALDLLNGRYSERTGRTDSQASLFDAFEDIPDDGRGTDERSADEFLAERAEARAEGSPVGAIGAIDEAIAANAVEGEKPWPGDVEFRDAGTTATDGEAVTAVVEGDQLAGRRATRKRS